MDDPLVSVRGEALLEVDPETAELTVAVGARDKHRDDALRLVDERQRAVRAVLDAFGDAVESVQTDALRIGPELKDGKAHERISGYHAVVRNGVVVRDFTRLGDLVARLAELEMVDVAGPWWALRRTSPVYREARVAAAREAVRRARDYAEALGSRLNGVVELADSGLLTSNADDAGWPGGARPMSAVAPMAAMGAARAMPESVALDLVPAKQTVRAVVEARFRMTPPSLDDH